MPLSVGSSVQTGAFSLTSGDNGTVIYFNAAANATITLPNNLPAGFNVIVGQVGAGQATFVPAAGAMLNARLSKTKTAGQYAEVSLVVRSNVGGAAATYLLAGDIA